MGKTVHTKGGIAGRARGLGKGEVCKSCPGGCKTDCLRAGVHIEETKQGGYDFSITFKTINSAFEPDMYTSDWDEGEPW